jgi:hypothetical protein
VVGKLTDSHPCPRLPMPRRPKFTPEQIAAFASPNAGPETVALPCDPAEFLTAFVERGRRAQAAVDEIIAAENKRRRAKRPKARA